MADETRLQPPFVPDDLVSLFAALDRYVDARINRSLASAVGHFPREAARREAVCELAKREAADALDALLRRRLADYKQIEY